MTPADDRRAWLKREMQKIPWITRGVPNWKAIAALVDGPLGALEEALEFYSEQARRGSSYRGSFALDTLARLPWREEERP